MSRLFLSPVESGPIDQLAPERGYEALLASVGYELRGRRAAEAVAGTGTAITGVEFTHGHDERYQENRRTYDALGSTVLRLEDSHFGAWALQWFRELIAVGKSRFAVDVSSMSRPRIAGVVSALDLLANEAEITVDFLYVPAVFAPPSPPADVTEALEPATAAFTGDPLLPDRRLFLLFGLGYEPEWAAAAIDEFSPEQALVFFPQGRDVRFEQAVAEANEPVFALPNVDEPLRYPVADPFRTFAEVDAIVREALRLQMRPLLLPLGPKIFAAVCFLVAVTGPTAIPVWRVSSGRFADAPDREPDDQLVTLRVATRPLRPAEPY
jgi:hypothetical protein